MIRLSSYIKNFLISVACLVIILACSNTGDKRIVEAWEKNLNKGGIQISYPQESTIFPPEIPAPTIIWDDKNKNSNTWAILIEIDGKPVLVSPLINDNNWKPDSASWSKIKSLSIEKKAIINILGFKKNNDNIEYTSNSKSSFIVSKDSVEAPIFFRAVTLPFIFAVNNLNTIQWRMGNVSSYSNPPIVLENLPVCGNCHSFTSDGKILAMDADYGNDKGSYLITSVDNNISLTNDKIITWSDYKKEDGQNTFGLLSQISPDGRYVASTVKDRSIFVPRDNAYYSQLFFPIKGIIVIYDRTTNTFKALPGADDPKFVQSNPVWSPDGKYIIFAKAPYYKVPEAENSKKAVLPQSLAKEFLTGERGFQFDLYRIPFNNGQGGVAEPLLGASNNGKSNYFPKYSPDGKWIVFNQAQNFMLLQPDSKLYIMNAQGGTPREMKCNTKEMNSWHSWSPNGKWIVFSSKANSPYTQLFLTHIDANGNDSPPVLLESFNIPDHAANIPEFVNLKPEYSMKIKENFMQSDKYLAVNADHKYNSGDVLGAISDYTKAMEKDPNNYMLYMNRGIAFRKIGQNEQALYDFNKALKIKPNDLSLIYERGFTLINLQNYKEAIKDYDIVLKQNKDYVGAYYERGIAKYSLEQYHEAIKDFNIVIKSDSNSGYGYLYRGLSFLALSNHTSACHDFHIAIELGIEEAQAALDDFCK